MLGPEWDVFIKPFPSKTMDLCARGDRKTLRASIFQIQQRKVDTQFQTQPRSCLQLTPAGRERIGFLQWKDTGYIKPTSEHAPSCQSTQNELCQHVCECCVYVLCVWCVCVSLCVCDQFTAFTMWIQGSDSSLAAKYLYLLSHLLVHK